MSQITLASGNALTGACSVPGDKSISHRAVMFGSIAEGDTYIRNFLDGGDCRATIDVMRGLGARSTAYQASAKPSSTLPASPMNTEACERQGVRRLNSMKPTITQASGSS
ncbi:MAG: hypothetical protein R6W76_19725, partial [Caldilinea sp.]